MCPWAQTATKSKEPRTPLVSAFLLPPFQQCIWKSGSEFGTARQVPAAWPATLAIALLNSAVVHLRQCVAWLQYAWACLGGMIHKGVQSCLVWICMNMSICAHHTCFPLLRETALLATYTKHDPRNQNRSSASSDQRDVAGVSQTFRWSASCPCPSKYARRRTPQTCQPNH